VRLRGIEGVQRRMRCLNPAEATPALIGMWLKRILHTVLLALVVLMSALGFPPPVSPRQAIRPSQEQSEPAGRE
jgi:hypothetical protein